MDEKRQLGNFEIPKPQVRQNLSLPRFWVLSY